MSGPYRAWVRLTQSFVLGTTRKSCKIHVAFLIPVTNCPLWMDQHLPLFLSSCLFIFVLCQCEIGKFVPGLMGTNGVQTPQGRLAHVPFCTRPSLNACFNKLHSPDTCTWNHSSFYPTILCLLKLMNRWDTMFKIVLFKKPFIMKNVKHT